MSETKQNKVSHLIYMSVSFRSDMTDEQNEIRKLGKQNERNEKKLGLSVYIAQSCSQCYKTFFGGNQDKNGENLDFSKITPML